MRLFAQYLERCPSIQFLEVNPYCHKSRYDNNVSEFIEDCRLVWSNAMAYNPLGHWVHQVHAVVTWSPILS